LIVGMASASVAEGWSDGSFSGSGAPRPQARASCRAGPQRERHPQLIRRLCDKLGPERLIFGSDYPLFSQARALKNVRQALTVEELEWVTHLNAERLLRPINDPIRDMR